jgi:rRNA-processing protein FCF1
VVEKLIRKHRAKGILVDTNILLLYFVGIFDPTLIARFKRTEIFAPDDFQKVEAVLNRFNRVLTTPHILAEISNLAVSLRGQAKDFFQHLSNGFIALDEKYTPARLLVTGNIFSRLGLTDAAIERLAMKGYLVFTADFELSQRLTHRGADVLNLNHLRTWN